MHSDCQFIGPLLTPAFATHALPALLLRQGLYQSGSAVAWKLVQRGLRDFAGNGGPLRVLHHIVSPLTAAFGYGEIRREESVTTREGSEDGLPGGNAKRIFTTGLANRVGCQH